MKRFIAILLCLSFSLSVISSASAVGVPADLENLANEYISVSTAGGTIAYTNLQAFYSAAKQEITNLSDLDLAKFTLSYTGQSYENYSDEIILETLDFFEITTITQIVKVAQDGSTTTLTTEEMKSLSGEAGISPAAIWESEDGYLQIETTASKGAATNYGTLFTLEAKATWLKIPKNRLTDTLAIAYGGTYDDSYNITGTFLESGSCEYCGQEFGWAETEIYGLKEGTQQFIQTAPDIELDFSQASAIGSKCDLRVVACPHMEEGSEVFVDYATASNIYMSIRFRIYASQVSEVKAAYAHRKIGGAISISGSVTPTTSGLSVTPVFSATAALTTTNYTAAPVTLRP